MAELSGFPSDWCFEQAANSGSSRMSQAPNHHLHSKLLTVTKSKEMTTASYRLCTFKCGFHEKRDNKLLQMIHHLNLAVITTNLQLYLKPCLCQSAFIYMYPLISEKNK